MELAVKEGVEQLDMPVISLALSSVVAGLILGFTPKNVGVVTQIFGRLEVHFISRIATAVVCQLGFVICIVSGTQLFTEHTATPVYPVLDTVAHQC